MGGYEMYNVCRLCLSENNTVFDIFESKGTRGWIAADVIIELLRFQVSSDDIYPHCVCTTCMWKLEDFKLFKQQCQTNKELLDRSFEVKHEIQPCEELNVRIPEHGGNQSELYDGEGDVEIPIEKGPLCLDVEGRTIKAEIEDSLNIATSDVPGHSSELAMELDAKNAEVEGQCQNSSEDSEFIIKEEVLDIPAESDSEGNSVEEGEAGEGALFSFGSASSVSDVEFVPDSRSASDSDSDISLSGKDDVNSSKAVLCPANSLTCGQPSNNDVFKDGMLSGCIPAHSYNKKVITQQGKRIRNQDFCFYCETHVINFARHLKRNHLLQLEVQKIFSKPAKSRERKELLCALRKKGNYLQNFTECMRPMKKSSQVRNSDHYLPCTHCLGFYARTQLWRHRKNCVENPLNGSIRSNPQIDAQNYLVNSLRVDSKLRNDVFPCMRPDKISLVAKKDALICAFGARYLKIHREKHFVNVTSRKMRELAKLLIEIRKIEPMIKNLFHALQPQFYDTIVASTKNVARYDSNKECFVSPTYAMNMGTSLKQCCDIAMTYALKKKGWYTNVQSAKAEADLKTMIQLLTANWRLDISNQAADDLSIKRWNKIKLIPLASDLQLLKVHLTTKANKAASSLMLDKTDETAFCELLETVFCRVLLLNRKHSGQLQRMLLHVYELSENTCQNYDEFDLAIISLTEKVLMKRFKCIITRGKRNWGVPVLFSLDVQEHITLLLSVRSNFVGKENPFLFGKPHLKTPLCGCKTLEKYAKACGATNPNAITSTRLRKLLATISQIFNMSDNEIEQLATFMEHTAGIHKNSYRLPDDVYQTAKISKLLLLMEKGEAADFKGKSLDEIDISLEEDLPLDDNTIDDADDYFPTDICETQESFNPGDNTVRVLNVPKPLSPSTTVVKGKKKRILVPWTAEQKEIVRMYFKNHIFEKMPPKRNECEALIEENPDVLHNKSWLKIKVFVQNAYTKK